MTEPLAISQQVLSSAPQDTSASPCLYLSSAQAGWGGLLMQAFHEPRELEGWMTPAMPDISLILLTGGAMCKEGDMPLACVALESGFANQSHFTQTFKRQIGLTPRAYRQGRSICAHL